jgi:hypothetical protein
MEALACAPSYSESAVSPYVLSLAKARQKMSELEAWMLSAEAMKKSISEVEREQERRAREAQRLLLQAHVQARGTGDAGPAIMTETETRTHRRLHDRHITTIFGEIRVERTAYSAEGRSSIHPLDEELEVSHRAPTYEVQRRVVKKSLQGPFDEALEHVEESTGILLSKRTAEQIVQDAAKDFADFYATRNPPPGAETGPILVAAADGKGVPIKKTEGARRMVRRGKGMKANKKRMATVAAVFTQQRRVRTPEEVVQSLFEPDLKIVDPKAPVVRVRPEHKRVWASLTAGKEAVLAEVAAEMVRRDPLRVKEWVAVTDGERALQRQAVAAIRKVHPGLQLVLDFLHALEYLWKAAYVFYPEGSPEAEMWVRERALRLLRGDVSQVVKGLRQSATKRRLRGVKAKTLRVVSAYFYRNRHRMRYHEYLAKGWPIASGAVEGACKNLVKDRMERSGMRWTPDMAEAVLQLRSTDRSGDFDDYWQFHESREQERLFPRNRWHAVSVVVEK